MKIAYCINRENEHARSLVAKLANNSKPGHFIFLIKEEMEVLADRRQFTTVEVSDKEE